MNVIFWDVDGVLNTPRTWGKHAEDLRKALDVDLVERAREVSQRLGAKCVMSSTWRLDYEGTLTALSERGWPDVREDFIGKTPFMKMSCIRGIEIGQWLSEHPEVKAFVIVDDENDMGNHRSRLVRTSYQTGLTPSNCDRIASLFDHP